MLRTRKSNFTPEWRSTDFIPLIMAYDKLGQVLALIDLYGLFLLDIG